MPRPYPCNHAALQTFMILETLSGGDFAEAVNREKLSIHAAFNSAVT
jgi:hypothetical protein